MLMKDYVYLQSCCWKLPCIYDALSVPPCLPVMSLLQRCVSPWTVKGSCMLVVRGGGHAKGLDICGVNDINAIEYL